MDVESILLKFNIICKTYLPILHTTCKNKAYRLFLFTFRIIIHKQYPLRLRMGCKMVFNKNKGSRVTFIIKV